MNTSEILPTPTDEDVAKTLAEYERIAQGTGEWDGREATEFSNDGVTFSPVWVKTAEHAHPLAARSTVHRKGVLIPTTEYAVWDEAYPADDQWRSIWDARPRVLFGAFVARKALKTAFRAALADRREPDDLPDARDVPPTAPERDWDAELDTAESVDVIDAVWADMKGARARTGAREKAYKESRASLIADAWGTQTDAAVDAWRPSPIPRPASKAEQPVPHPPTVKLGVKPEPRPKVPAKHRPRNPAMTAALAAAVQNAEGDGRPVARVVRRAVREQGKP